MDREFSRILLAVSLILIILISVVRLPPGWLFTLYMADMVICGAFAWDFVSRLHHNPDKPSFWKYHGYEVLAAVPVVVFYPVIPLSILAIALRMLNLVHLLSTPEWITSFNNQIIRFRQKTRFLFKLPPLQ